MQSMRITRFCSEPSTVVESRKFNLARLLLLRILCEVFAWKRLIFPDPVTENLFLALEWVFIFGMIVFFSVGKYRQIHLIRDKTIIYFLRFGDTMTIIRRPSSFGKASGAPYSSSSFKKRNKRSSPRSLNTMVLPLKFT